uniref:Family with sequence similarity 107 member A n=1 Tax=Mastacembelus armatus TaxID=205130 RepID=A0A3Q3MUB7_9TELE
MKFYYHCIITSLNLVIQADLNEQEDRCQELQAFPPQLPSEEKIGNLITPQKALNLSTASKSHRELHKKLQMTHMRKTELQRALEKRKWEQKMKARREQEETNKNKSPLYQELLKRHEREEKEQQQHEPKFLRVKERLRKTAVLDGGEKEA